MNTNTALMERKIKDIQNGTTPRGVKYAEDQGIQRMVYIDVRNKWVFKVGPENINAHETAKAIEAREILKDHPTYRVPETVMIDGVVVMEYIKGHMCDFEHGLWDFWENIHQRRVEQLLGVGDIHGQNVIFDGKYYWIVDLGWRI